MTPLSMILRKVTAGYESKGKSAKINHLLFMDDLKLFGKTQDQIDSLIKAIQLFSSDIGMVFGIDKCGALIMKRGKDASRCAEGCAEGRINVLGSVRMSLIFKL